MRHMFYGLFWTENSIATVILPFDLIVYRYYFATFRSRSGQKGQFLIFEIFENKDMFLIQNVMRNPIVPLVFSVGFLARSQNRV